MTRALPMLFVVVALGCGPGQRVRGHVQILGADSSAGVSVRVAEPDGASTVTDDQGDFTLPSWSATPTLVVTADSVTPPLLTVSAGPQPLELTFTAVGTVTGLATRGGAPAGNAGIAVSTDEQTTVTDDVGRYSLTLPVGTVVIQATTSGYATAVSQPVPVSRGKSSVAEPLLLPLTGYGWSGTIAGSVVRVGGPRRDSVRVLVEGAGRFTVTRADGTFEIPDVPEGSYTLALEYDGLVERVPNVMAARGSDGLLVDTRVYRLGDKPIPLMAASRVDSTLATLTRPRGPFVTWAADDGLHRTVRWLDVRTGTVADAGRLDNRGWSTPVPTLTPDAGAILWQREGHELVRTSTRDGTSDVLATSVQRALDIDYQASAFSISPAGLIAYEGYLEDRTALLVAGEDGSGVREVKRWPDANAHVYQGTFFGETLLAVSDVSNQAPAVLTLWRDGPGVVRATTGSQYVYPSPDRRFVELREYWSYSFSVIDTETGQLVISHDNGNGEGMFSSDSAAYAWINSGGTVSVVDLPGGPTHLLSIGPLTWSSRLRCVEPEAVVVQDGNGLLVSLPRDGSPPITLGTSAPNVSCGGGRVFWSTWTSGQRANDELDAAPILGGEAVRLFTGAVAGWYLQVRPEDQRVWFGVGDGNSRELWTAADTGGPAVKVVEDSSQMPLFSPDGLRAAVVAGSGLWVGHSDGTGFTRIASSVNRLFWVDAHRLAFSMAPPEAPFRFQGGVWIATVP